MKKTISVVVVALSASFALADNKTIVQYEIDVVQNGKTTLSADVNLYNNEKPVVFDNREPTQQDYECRPNSFLKNPITVFTGYKLAMSGVAWSNGVAAVSLSYLHSVGNKGELMDTGLCKLTTMTQLDNSFESNAVLKEGERVLVMSASSDSFDSKVKPAVQWGAQEVYGKSSVEIYMKLKKIIPNAGKELISGVFVKS